MPKTKKQLRSFIGLIKYYRDIWVKRSELLAPLSSSTYKRAKWTCTECHQKAFENIQIIVSRETVLTYPNFNETFEIYHDGSHTQLGVVICHKEKRIAFYSRRPNPEQTRCTTTERELLYIVETLKTILLG